MLTLNKSTTIDNILEKYTITSILLTMTRNTFSGTWCLPQPSPQWPNCSYENFGDSAIK